jgi:cyanophycinase
MRKYFLILASIALGYASSFAQPSAQTNSRPSPITIKPSPTLHGPEKGSLLIIGGNVGSTTSRD